ncbi:Uncharacterised protein [Candidatus Gugararchaeum adminiculabundum]|nr:Uncharacterised protein [Candidatus Gugararchaeum adminiculabundum]
MANDMAIVTRARQSPVVSQLKSHLSAFFKPALNENGFIHLRRKQESNNIIKLRAAMITLKSASDSGEKAKAGDEIDKVFRSIKYAKRNYLDDPRFYPENKGASADLKKARNLAVPNVIKMLGELKAVTDENEMLILIPLLDVAGDRRGYGSLHRILNEEIQNDRRSSNIALYSRNAIVGIMESRKRGI